jgi:hypothetical protein
MENLFEEILLNCKHKRVESLCRKLSKKLSFKSGSDVENLCHLTYWLYILGYKEYAKKCIELTRDIPFDRNYNVWTFLHFMWGLEIRLLREDGKNKEAEEIANTMNQHSLTPSKQFNETPEKMEKNEAKRRDRFVLGTESGQPMGISNQEHVERALNNGDNKSANRWRFTSLLALIGCTETGLYPHLNEDKEKIEEVIKNYISEIVK